MQRLISRSVLYLSRCQADLNQTIEMKNLKLSGIAFVLALSFAACSGADSPSTGEEVLVEGSSLIQEETSESDKGIEFPSIFAPLLQILSN